MHRTIRWRGCGRYCKRAHENRLFVEESLQDRQTVERALIELKHLTSFGSVEATLEKVAVADG